MWAGELVDRGGEEWESEKKIEIFCGYVLSLMMSNTNILFSLDFQINFALHDDPDPLQTQPFARIVSYWLMDKSS
jgi:hypothetical protein